MPKQRKSMLDTVLAACAATATCQEFIEKDGESVAVVVQEDVIAYADAKNLGTFKGKHERYVSFVRVRDGKVIVRLPGTSYEAAVCKFLGVSAR